jgi:hypothetical protein
MECPGGFASLKMEFTFHNKKNRNRGAGLVR